MRILLRRGPHTLLAAAAALIVLAPSPARSDLPRFGPHDVTSLFSISKSENKNEVIYAIHLDAHCAPAGEAPVFAYWRMNEKGPDVIEPILPHEESAYGIGRQQVLERGAAGGGKVWVTLRAIASRPIVVETKPAAGHCDAWSSLPIDGKPAYLFDVYVKIRGLGVEYVLLSGWAEDRTHIVHEKLVR